jgi:hypothetical protein
MSGELDRLRAENAMLQRALEDVNASSSLGDVNPETVGTIMEREREREREEKEIPLHRTVRS